MSITTYLSTTRQHIRGAYAILQSVLTRAVIWWFGAGLVSVLMLAFWRVLLLQLDDMHLHLPWWIVAVAVWLLIEFGLAVLSVMVADCDALGVAPNQIVVYVARRFIFCVLIRLLSLFLIAVGCVLFLLPGLFFAVISSVFTVAFFQQDKDFFSLVTMAVDIVKHRAWDVFWVLLPWWLFNAICVVGIALMIGRHATGQLITIMYMILLAGLVWLRCMQRLCLEADPC